MGQEFITEPARRIPVLCECDVAVVGGGTGGIIAAIASARQGVKTVLIEKLGALGGLLTVGMNTKPSGRIVGGIPLEVWRRAEKEGLAGKNIVLTLERKDEQRSQKMEISTACDAEGMKFLALTMCAEAGVKVLFECQAVAPLMEGKTVKGVIIESKAGRQAVKAGVVVDCSADADIAAGAGAPFIIGDNGPMQPVSMFFKVNQVDMDTFTKWAVEHPDDVSERFIDAENPEYAVWATGFTDMLRKFQKEKGVDLQRENVTLKTGRGRTEIYCNNTRARGFSGFEPLRTVDAITELYRQIQLNAQFLKENVPGFEDSYINGLAPVLGVRESRHIVGEYTMTDEDGLGGGRFEDSIGIDESGMDYHEVNGKNAYLKAYPPYEIPYRALVPREIDQLIVGGRIIACTHTAHGRTRTIPAVMTTSQAAGMAAALAVRNGTTIRKLDVRQLQSELRKVDMPLFASEYTATSVC